MREIEFQYLLSRGKKNNNNKYNNNNINNYCWLLSDSLCWGTIKGEVCHFQFGRMFQVSLHMHGKAQSKKRPPVHVWLSESWCLFDLNLLLNAGLSLSVRVCQYVFLRRDVGQTSTFRVISKNKSHNVWRTQKHEDACISRRSCLEDNLYNFIFDDL